MRLITAVLLASYCGAGAGCSGPMATPESRTVRLFDILNVDVRDVPMMLALDDLREQGYQIETTYMSSSALIADALVRGDADIGIGNNQTMWKAAVQGAPIRTIAEFTASTTALAAATEFEACGELDGKRLGVASTRGLSPALFDMYIEHDCPGTHPEILVVLESAGRAAALLSGEIDAVILPGEELIKLQREAPGKFHSLMFYGEVFRDVRIDSLHVARPWAERNPETVKDFLRALLRAQRRVAADPQLLYDEAVQRLELDPAAAEAIGRSHLGMNIWDPNGGLTAENLQGTLDLLIAVEALPAGTEVREVADLSYLNGVLNEIGRK